MRGRGVNLLSASVLALLLLLGGWQSASALDIRVSIKVILGPGGEWPDNTDTVGTTGVNLNSETAIRDNIKLSNRILASHGIGYQFVLRADTVYTLSGFANSWFTRNARDAAFRDDLEAAATASAQAKQTWQWHDDSINIYINDSRSGVCSRPVDAKSVITIGAGAYDELIVHEIGHFFALDHTHVGSEDNMVNNWGDGDGFSETLDDDPDASASDINNRYDGNPQPFQPQSVRDDLIFNIMSYHSPQDRFVWQQRERFIDTMNGSRSAVALGRIRYVAPDGNNSQQGLSLATRVATIGRALQLTTLPNDVVLIQSGTYSLAAQGASATLSQPTTYSARRGPVTLNP